MDRTEKVNQSLLRFLKRLGLLILIITALDQIIGNTLRYFYFKESSGMHYRTTFAMEKTTAEVLVFGSSRANHHYHPKVFETRLGQSFYNAGKDASHIFYHYAVLQAVLKRYTPKMIILNFSRGDFMKNQASYDRIAALLPYYKDHPEIRPVINLKSPFENIKLISSIYPFNSGIFTIAAGNSEFNKTRRGDVKGYVSTSEKWNGIYKSDTTQAEYEVDSIRIKFFTDFILDCKRAGTRIYIVCSPNMIRFKKQDTSVVIAEKIAAEQKVPFWDFLSDPDFMNDRTLFADETHLNDNGARLLSDKVVDKILHEE